MKRAKQAVLAPQPSIGIPRTSTRSKRNEPKAASPKGKSHLDPGGFVFKLELAFGLIFFQEFAQLLGGVEQANPLLVV